MKSGKISTTLFSISYKGLLGPAVAGLLLLSGCGLFSNRPNVQFTDAHQNSAASAELLDTTLDPASVLRESSSFKIGRAHV